MLLLLIVGQGVCAESPQIDRRNIDTVFNRELARICSQLEPAQQQALLKRFGKHHDPSRDYLYIGSRPELHEVPAKIQARLRRLEKHYAKELDSLLKTSLSEHQFGRAMRLLHEIAYHDPSHDVASAVLPDARRPVDFSARLSRASHRTIGWQKGKYWRISTPSFQIATNATEQHGRQLATLLENLVSAWRQVFFEYASGGPQLEEAVNNKTRLVFPRRKHRIVLFASRQDYVRYLSTIEPFARQTLGYYSAKNETAYFFMDEHESLQSTWLHETTHQLFHETRRVRRDIGRDHNFWLVEGVALYMESLQPLSDGCWSVGGLEADRLQFARHRRIAENYYVPLASLTKLGQQQLQGNSDIRKLYSQAAGLTQFFVHAKKSALRDSFFRYLIAVYSGRSAESALFNEFHTSASELDAMYAEFLRVKSIDLIHLDPRVRPKNLSLRNMEIDDASLQNVDLTDVRWLDASFTNVSDHGLKNLSQAQLIHQLSLENTAIGDETVRRLAGAKYLSELDLSGTKITDASCDILKTFSNLTSLWLDRTQISASKKKDLRQVLTKLSR